MAVVKWWGIGALLACLALVIAYIPPRGNVSARGRPLFLPQSPQATPARRRAHALAEQWRLADAAARLHEERDAVRTTRPKSLTLSVRTTESVQEGLTRSLTASADSAWRSLGLSETKIQVALILDLTPPARTRDRPAAERLASAYLAPDSTNRTLCIALLQPESYWRDVVLGRRQPHENAPRLTDWLSAGLGPCAFYAKYGAPSGSVRRWLDANAWDVASILTLSDYETSRRNLPFLDPAARWFWSTLYAFPPSLIACLSGREEGCRAAVLDGVDRGEGAAPSVIRPEGRWWLRQRLIPAQRYLSDVAREVGGDRFQRFWTSSLPLDTSFALALKQPVGRWTAQWERRFVPPFRLGPAVPLGSATVASVFAVAAVLVVAGLAIRRQVR